MGSWYRQLCRRAISLSGTKGKLSGAGLKMAFFARSRIRRLTPDGTRRATVRAPAGLTACNGFNRWRSFSCDSPSLMRQPCFAAAGTVAASANLRAVRMMTETVTSVLA